MNSNEGPAAPASGTSDPAIPTFAELAADPEIAALLDFEPVVRKVKRPDGWTDELQRELIARLAWTGNLQAAVWQMEKHATGAQALYHVSSADEFRASWDAALAIGRRRNGLDCGPPFTGDVPGITRRRPKSPSPLAGEVRGEGEVLNEFGEYEDEESLHRRADEARDNVAGKLLKLRRLYLQEISSSPGKRAAFEILSDFDVDWDKAERCEPQGDEPYAAPSMRDPQFLLTAEAGWMGHMARGPDKVAELRAAIDEHREAEGLPPVDWSDA